MSLRFFGKLTMLPSSHEKSAAHFSAASSFLPAHPLSAPCKHVGSRIGDKQTSQHSTFENLCQQPANLFFRRANIGQLSESQQFTLGSTDYSFLRFQCSVAPFRWSQIKSVSCSGGATAWAQHKLAALLRVQTAWFDRLSV